MWRRLRVDDIQSLLKELKAFTIARISNTSTWLNTHINSGLRSLVFCCVPGRSHRKFHAPLHTENVSFILPTGDKRKEEWKTELEKKGNPLCLTYVGVTRWNTAMATHTQQSKGGTWSQVQWNVTFMRAKHKGRNFPSKTGARKLKEKCQEFKVFLTLDQIFFPYKDG